MPSTEDDVISRVRGFIQETFLYMRPDFVLGDDDGLLESGVVDSMGVMELMSFLESEFGVVPEEHEITLANLGTLRAIARFVTSRAGASAQ